MAIVVTKFDGGNSTANAISFATTSLTPVANRTYLLVVRSQQVSGNVPTVSGRNLTWTEVAHTADWNTGNKDKTTVFRGTGAAPALGVLTIDFAGQAQTVGVAWFEAEITGEDYTNPVVQAVTATGNDTTPTATLAAFGSASNGTVVAMSTASTSDYTPGTGFALLASEPWYGTNRTSVEWRADNDTSCDATITSAPWGIVAMEIKVAAAAATILGKTTRAQLIGNPERDWDYANGILVGGASPGVSVGPLARTYQSPYGAAAFEAEDQLNFPAPYGLHVGRPAGGAAIGLPPRHVFQSPADIALRAQLDQDAFLAQYGLRVSRPAGGSPFAPSVARQQGWLGLSLGF